jgi:hypothetical protein
MEEVLYSQSRLKRPILDHGLGRRGNRPYGQLPTWRAEQFSARKGAGVAGAILLLRTSAPPGQGRRAEPVLGIGPDHRRADRRFPLQTQPGRDPDRMPPGFRRLLQTALSRLRRRRDPLAAVDAKGNPMVKPCGAQPQARLAKGQKANKKRMSTVATVFTRAHCVRTPLQVIESPFPLPALHPVKILLLHARKTSGYGRVCSRARPL